MRKLNLQLFSGGHSVTVVADGGFSAASASSTSDVQKNADVTLTLTPSSGKEIASVEVLSGGVTLTVTEGVYGFKMGEANVVIVAKSKANNLYKITENREITINGTKTKLTKNITEKKAKNGVVYEIECTPTAVTAGDVIPGLVDEGVLIKV
jgi:hypothetical protein